eukprot:TRINITY_DN13999_c0_g1_i2.p1 TRINITY_DN13999_c0_g1~~TRINITY_DN13999_c0_g1_i2.p1  ORF type:complete len:284 (+),score=22.54 TRINITY_DN13999_c0_g1_i2:134-985(+)
MGDFSLELVDSSPIRLQRLSFESSSSTTCSSSVLLARQVSSFVVAKLDGDLPRSTVVNSASSPPVVEERYGDNEDDVDNNDDDISSCGDDDGSSTSTIPMLAPSSSSDPHHLPLSTSDFTAAETLLIFDWDDTILPSTWLSRAGLRLDTVINIPEPQDSELKCMAESAFILLSEASRLGTVIIVTNAERGWIEMSCGKFMPTILDFITDFPKYSARSTFEPLGFFTPLEWKVQAFGRVVREHYGSRTSLSRRNILSIGDSSHERDAILTVSYTHLTLPTIYSV